MTNVRMGLIASEPRGSSAKRPGGPRKTGRRGHTDLGLVSSLGTAGLTHFTDGETDGWGSYGLPGWGSLWDVSLPPGSEL